MTIVFQIGKFQRNLLRESRKWQVIVVIHGGLA